MLSAPPAQTAAMDPSWVAATPAAPVNPPTPAPATTVRVPDSQATTWKPDGVPTRTLAGAPETCGPGATALAWLAAREATCVQPSPFQAYSVSWDGVTVASRSPFRRSQAAPTYP